MGSVFAARLAGMNPATAATVPSSTPTAVSERRSVLLKPKRKLCNTRPPARASGNSDHNTGCYQQHGLAQHQSQNIAAPGAQRHTDADFARPPGDRIRHDPIEPNACEQQRQSCKETRNLGQCDLIRRAGRDQAVERLYKREWQMRISCLDLAYYTGHDLRGHTMSLRLDYDLDGVRCLLETPGRTSGLDTASRSRCRCRGLLHHERRADDRERLVEPIRIVDSELTTHGILAVEETLNQSFIHYGYACRGRGVLRLNSAACQNGNAHHFEIIGTNVVLRRSAIGGTAGDETGNDNGIVRFTAREQSIGGVSDGANPGCAPRGEGPAAGPAVSSSGCYNQHRQGPCER